MQLIRLKWATAIALAVAVTGAGVAAVVPQALAAAEDADKVKAELKKFQGTWVDVHLEKAGQKIDQVGNHRLTFEGETFHVVNQGRDDAKGRIALDPSTNPMQIEIRYRDGNNEDRTMLGIYAWDGDDLKLCWGEPGTDTRPTDFTTTGERRVLMVVRRQAP